MAVVLLTRANHPALQKDDRDSSKKPQSTEEVVLGIVYNSAGQILVTQRYDPVVPDSNLYFDLVGGKRKTEESFEEALMREAVEEVGLRIRIERRLSEKPFIANWKHRDYEMECRVYCLTAKHESGRLVALDKKIRNPFWANTEDLAELNRKVKFNGEAKGRFLPSVQHYFSLAGLL